jgi:hypothetical protein
MNKFIKAIVAGLFAMTSGFAFAAKPADGISGFTSSGACVLAVAKGQAKAYVPVTNRNPGSAYVQKTMADAGYQNGACVQGLTTFSKDVWVYLPASFNIGQSGENIVMWQCGNAVTSIAAIAMNQNVTQLAPQTSFTQAACTESAEKCEQIKWCDDNKGWAVQGNERVCRIPGQNSRIVQEDVLNIDRRLTVNPRVLPTTVNPWQGNGDFTVPAAPQARGSVAGSQGPSVDFGRGQAGSVGGQSCHTQGCSSRPVATFVSEVKASYCGIRTTDARLFRLGSASDGSLVVADWTKGTEGRKMIIRGETAGTDCDKAQTAVESKHWMGVTNFFSLPNGCAVTQRHTGLIANN